MEISPPEELVFQKVANGSNPKQILTLSNTLSNVHIAFKVKTTAPKQFCVRPNAGKLAPGEKCEIQVILQLREGATLDVKRKDKFLVQGIKLPEQLVNESNSSKIADFWTQTEQLKKTNPGSESDIIIEKKLRCVYLIGEATITTTLEVPNRSSNQGDKASIYNFDEAEPSGPGSTGISQ
jgi:hypothetical protein